MYNWRAVDDTLGANCIVFVAYRWRRGETRVDLAWWDIQAAMWRWVHGGPIETQAEQYELLGWRHIEFPKWEV